MKQNKKQIHLPKQTNGKYDLNKLKDHFLQEGIMYDPSVDSPF